MTNHVHLIISSKNARLEELVRDIKKFTSKQIIKAISENPEESRKEWMLNMFRFIGTGNKNNKEFPRLTVRAGILETGLSPG